MQLRVEAELIGELGEVGVKGGRGRRARRAEKLIPSVQSPDHAAEGGCAHATKEDEAGGSVPPHRI